MRFSLTYQEYRLLDIKALTECHLYFLATASDLKQSLPILGIRKLSDTQYEMLKDICNSLYHIFKGISLSLFYELIQRIINSEINTVEFPDALCWHIDLNDYLDFIAKLYTLRTEKSNKFAEDIGNESLNGVLKFIRNDKDLPNKYFKHLFGYNSNYENTDGIFNSNSQELLSNLFSIISEYLRLSFAQSYSQILFEKKNVLIIYAEHVDTIYTAIAGKIFGTEGRKYDRDPEFRRLCNQQIITFGFSQECNSLTIYGSYIVGMFENYKGISAMVKIGYNSNVSSMLINNNSDGKAIAIIDRPNVITRDNNNCPPGLVDSGIVLQLTNDIENSRAVKKTTRKANAISLLTSKLGFGYSSRAMHKYLLKLNREGSLSNPTEWCYSGYVEFKDRALPLHNIVSDILESDCDYKSDTLTAIWKDIRKVNTQPVPSYRFKVRLPSDEYTSLMLQSADPSVQKEKSNFDDIKYVMSAFSNIDSFLYSVWRSNTANPSASMEDFLSAVINNNAKISDADIMNYNTIKLVTNELIILNEQLKKNGLSLGKLWYLYLSDNFVRDRLATKRIFNASGYAYNIMYNPAIDVMKLNLRYPANTITRDNFKLVTANFGNLLDRLSHTVSSGSEDSGIGTTTSFASFRRHLRAPNAMDLVQSDLVGLGALGDAHNKFDLAVLQEILNGEVRLSVAILDFERSPISNADAVLRKLLNYLQSVGLYRIEFGTDDNPLSCIMDEDILKTYENTSIANLFSLNTIATVNNSDGSNPLKKYGDSALIAIGLLLLFTFEECDKNKLIEHLNLCFQAYNGMSETIMSGNPKLIPAYEKIYSSYISPAFEYLFITELQRADSKLPTSFREFIELLTTRILDQLHIFSRTQHSLQVFMRSYILLPLLLDKGEQRQLAITVALSSFLKSINSSGPFTIISKLGERLNLATEEDLWDDIDQFMEEPTQQFNSNMNTLNQANSLINVSRTMFSEALTQEQKQDYIQNNTFFTYAFYCLDNFWREVKRYTADIDSIIRDKLYLQEDYRPLSGSVDISKETANNLYKNLCRIFANDNITANAITSSISSALAEGYTSYSIYQNIDNPQLDVKFLYFMYSASANTGERPGLKFKTHMTRYGNGRIPCRYYLHSSGLYICSMDFGDNPSKEISLALHPNNINSGELND